VYEDKATGTNTSRPQYRKLMVDARARKLDLILVWKLDRMARSLKDLILTLQELSDLGVTFVSLRDNLDLSTSARRLMLHIVGAFAQFEADVIKERVLAGLAAAKANGTKLGRPARIDSARVLELRRQGYSLSRIAREIGATKSAVSKTHRKIASKNPLNMSETIQSSTAALSRRKNL
jgi:DNA invertase Pin-like site-specific DNA recombinase